MFSSRLKWSLATNRLSACLDRKRASGTPVLDLTASNPTRAGLHYPEKEILAAFGTPSLLHYEPDPRGLAAARQAVADYYRVRGQTISADSIVLTASTSEAYAFLFKLLANPGDDILVPQPSYPLFDFLASLESVHVVRYPLRYVEAPGWRIDVDRLANSISTTTRAIVLVNPNNPTGSFIRRDELRTLNALCIEHDLALIVDEVFADFCYTTTSETVRSLVGNPETLTFVLSGLSKVCALPQVKLGWIHMSGPGSVIAETSERLELIADTYLSVGTPVQQAAGALLALHEQMQRQITRRVLENDKLLRELCCRESGCRVLKMEGGWYAIVEISGLTAEEDYCLALLEEDDVFVHPGYFFDFTGRGAVVVSLLTPPAEFAAGASRMVKRRGRI